MDALTDTAAKAPPHPLAEPPAISRDAAVSRIAAILRRERAERAARRAAAEPADGEEAIAESESDTASPAIAAEEDPLAPPAGWSREDLVIFFQLPAEAQAIIARRERERDRGLRRRLDLIGRESKALDAERERAARLLTALEERLATAPPADAAGEEMLTPRAEETLRAETREALAAQEQALARARQARELTALLHAIPEWQSREKLQTEAQELDRFLVRNGFGSDELADLYDHRAIVLARKAMLYDKLMQSKPLAEKKLAAAPSMLQPGSGAAKDGAPDRTRSALIQRYRETGRPEDAVKVIADFIRK